jgi:hypothetical protein
MKPVRFVIKKYKMVAWSPTEGYLGYHYMQAPNIDIAIKKSNKVRNLYVKPYKHLKWKAVVT